MGRTLEFGLIVIGALPGAYALLCWVRRTINTLKTAKWIRENYSQEWNSLHWLSKQFPWGGIEALITKGLISGPEVDQFRFRDDYYEKAIWIGLLSSALLLAVILLVTEIVAKFG